MISRLRSWYQKRKRAEMLGRASHANFWYDPVTEQTWQAKTRYSLFPVESNKDSPEGIAQMCHLVHLCELTEEGERYLPEKYRRGL